MLPWFFTLIQWQLMGYPGGSEWGIPVGVWGVPAGAPGVSLWEHGVSLWECGVSKQECFRLNVVCIWLLFISVHTEQVHCPVLGSALTTERAPQRRGGPPRVSLKGLAWS